VGDAFPWYLRWKLPTSFRTQWFWPISAHSTRPSTVITAKKVQLALNRKWATRFSSSNSNEPYRTMYVTPKSPKGWQKKWFCCFYQQNSTYLEKRLLQSFLCENFQRQSCSYIIPYLTGLTVHRWIGDRPNGLRPTSPSIPKICVQKWPMHPL